MSTRSEIRIYKNNKLDGCVYHHMDGYPEHIVSDLFATGESSNAKKIIQELSTGHGTHNMVCAHGDKSEKNQSDIEYSYNLFLKEEKSKSGFRPAPSVEKLQIFHHPFHGKKQKVFEGGLYEAHNHFLCKRKS